MKPSNILGVDVGGTFTDLLLFDAETKAFRTAKVPSQRGDEAAGFMQGIATVSAGREIARSFMAPPSAPIRCWSGEGTRSV